MYTTEKENAEVTKIMFDLNATEGKEIITRGKDKGTLLAFPGTAYVNGNTAFLENYIGIPKKAAGSHGGQWISITSSFTNYSSLVVGSTLDDINLIGPAAKSATLRSTTLEGKRVVAISGPTAGTDVGDAFGEKGSQTVYVLASQPYTASGFHLRSQYSQESPNGYGFQVVDLTLDATLTHWGEQVDLTPPTNAVPIATIVGSSS